VEAPLARGAGATGTFARTPGAVERALREDDGFAAGMLAPA